MRALAPLALVLISCSTAAAEPRLCKYVDPNGVALYAYKAPPEPGWFLATCFDPVLAENRRAPSSKIALRERIQIGMTDEELRNLDPRLRFADHRRSLRSATGRDEWLEYHDDTGPAFVVHLHNGRVSSVYQH